MHEIVRQKIEGLRRQGAKVVVLEATLLIEAKWTDLVDQVWVTITPEDAVINRLVSQKGFTKEQARARIESQTPIAQRAKQADVVIRNDSNVDTLRKRVEELWRRLRSTRNDCVRTLLAEGIDWKQEVKKALASRERRVVTKEGYRASAVLIPIYENKNEHYIVLTKRTQSVMYHKGQISFPGGAQDTEDHDLTTTALREAFEEIGVRPDHVEILGRLDDQSTYTSRFVITPFVGAIPYPYKFKVSRKEVEELIEVPISALLKPGCFNPETQDEEGRTYPWGHYVYRKHKITGITARILKQLLDSVFTS